MIAETDKAFVEITKQLAKARKEMLADDYYEFLCELENYIGTLIRQIRRSKPQ